MQFKFKVENRSNFLILEHFILCRAEIGGYFVIFYFRESLQSTSNTLPSPEPLKEINHAKNIFL